MTSNIFNPFVPCHATIYLDEAHRTSTYCMREKGHADEGVKGFPGGHNLVNKAAGTAAAPEVKRDQAA
jgi:hypothetical protein